MPTPTIPAGNLFMNATLYTGNNSTNVITNGSAGASFQPDMVWTKARANAYSPNLYDSVRGVNQNLQPNSTGAEFFNAGSLTSFNSNGFTVGANDNGNASSSSVGWQWKAGGTAVSNTSGTITSSVSANTTSGFSVVTFTATGSNATVGHGLGVAPAVVIVKDRASAGNWAMYHQSLPSAAYYLYLNTTAAQGNTAQIWNSTAPTSSVFSIGTWHTADAQVAYCWAPIAGYSAFGSYTGNGSTDGPFVYLGFRPAFIMIKRTDSSGTDWVTMDYQRLGYNVTDVALNPNASYAENSGYATDFVSNGFKLRTTTSFLNGSGATYIYMAFAQNPFKYANAR